MEQIEIKVDYGMCDVCGKEKASHVAASAFGPVSFAYCTNCLEKGLEPYSAMVDYIACAGYFPDDINETYKNLCRTILKELNIPEEVFIKDVKNAVEEIW